MILQRARNTTLDYADAQGYTAQHMAAHYHHADILWLLADRGANVNLVDRRGNTALGLAVAPNPPGAPPRDLDPDGARQFATVHALLQLNSGTMPRAPSRPPSYCMT